MQELVDYVGELHRLQACYSIIVGGDDFLIVTVTTPVEYWEISFYVDGKVTAEVFESREFLKGKKALKGPLKFWGDRKGAQKIGEMTRHWVAHKTNTHGKRKKS